MPNNFAVLDQHDFTAGELDPQAKRGNDDPLVKSGARQLLNARILNTKGVANRQGRNALQRFTVQARVEEILISPGLKFRFAFTNANLDIYDASGAAVFNEAARGWTGANLGQIVIAVYLNQAFITFPGVVPEVLTWDGVSTWSSAAYAEITVGNHKNTIFYRIAPHAMTLAASGTTGSITLTASANYFVNGMVGARLRYVGRQLLITAVGSATPITTATATVEETLPSSMILGFASDPSSTFAAGDEIIGSVTGSKGLVTGVSGLFMQVTVQLLSVPIINSDGTSISTFSTADNAVGPGGSIKVNALVSFGNPLAIAAWDEEVMNSYRGYPASCFVDQGRLGFCNFPSVPGGVIWSAIGTPTDLDLGTALPSNAFIEIVPGKNRAQHVVPGPESSEMVFCDNGVFYIPISPANPLKAGSVQFQKISSDGAGTMQPRSVGEVIVFADQGLTQLYSIIATGSYSRPFVTAPLTDLHSHLFNNIQAIALPSSVTQFPERYAYVLNGDGTVAVGKYTLDESGKLAGKIGWLPWNGFGTVKWVAALGDAVQFVTAYTQGATTAYMLEQLDVTQYLDAAVLINNPPTAMAPPGGKGPMWWLPLATVDLMDGAFPLGPHTTDANGFILPTQPGEDLTSLTLHSGFTWTGVIEPFLPPVQGGQDGGQRMKKRRCARFEVYVANSSGFAVRQIYTGQQGRSLPALGTYMGGRRIPAYNQDDDATKAPPLREQAYTTRPRGRAHDPRIAIVKDTPGPLTVVEISARVST